MNELLIKGGTVVTSAWRCKVNITADGGVIQAITKAEPKAERVIDAEGKLILPGIIDVHTHIREPGYTHKEDFESGTRGAAVGGVVFVAPQPNLDPVPNTVENYRKEIEIGEKKSLVDFNPPASPLLYEEGWVPKLVEEGTAWFKIFQRVAAYPYDTAASTANTAHIYEAFKEIGKCGSTCGVHPFDQYFYQEVPRHMKKAGIPMTLLNWQSYPLREMVWNSAAHQLFYLAKKAGMKFYAMHCYLPDYVEMVRRIKTSKEWDVIASAECIWGGLPSTGPTGERVYDAKREEWFESGFPIKVGRKEVWEGLIDGTLDVIATDHAPHHREEIMTEDPLKAALGLPSLEWAGHLLLNEVNNGTISLERLIQVTSENPAKLFLRCYPRKGAILPGSDADLIICDMDREWTITSDKVYTKTQLNPFHGKKIKGKITHTILRGQVIMEEGEVLAKPGYGQFIKPMT